MGIHKTDYIRKHKDYIDFRIERIHHAINDPDSRFSIQEIIFHLIGTVRCDLTNTALQSPVTDLENILSGWSIENDGDFVGYIYQSLQSGKNLKKKGQFFTPPEIVDQIITSTIHTPFFNEEMKLLDPACGSGQFLISVFKKIRNNFVKNGCDIIQAGKLSANLLYGLDTDETAVEIAKWNIAKISGCHSDEIHIFTGDFLNKESLYLNSFPLKGLHFDYIIGNPPWGSSLSAELKKYYRSNYGFAKSGINTFTLFIERSLELLNNEGKLGFLVPEAFLNIKAHLQSRYSILNRSVIEEICQWGELFKNVFAPSISIIIKHEENFDVIRSNIIKVINGCDLKKGTYKMIPQMTFNSTHEYIFNINYSSSVVNLVSYISDVDCMYLANNAQFFLGIVTGNNDKFISPIRSSQFPDPIITGKDIIPYKSIHGGKYFKFEPESLQQVAPEYLYRTKNKVFYKFIGRNLTFALDTDGVFSLNNVNAFIPESSVIAPEALVAVLNSSLMQYYYQNNFFTVKVLRGNLEKLPIKKLSRSSERKLIMLSNEASGSYSLETYLTASEKIDDIVFNEYGIKDKYAHGVFNDYSMSNRIKNYDSYFQIRTTA
jgi:SAM-dependent methyltransferase